MKIYKKLLEVQKEVKGLGKDQQSGSGNFGYKYVTGGKVLDHIKPILNAQGLLLKQEIVKVETERIDYTTKNGSKSEMLYKVWQKFTWIDVETGDKDENEFFSAGQNDWEKGLGSALTYAERYFLLKYFHIATDEDDIDNSDRKAKEEEEDKKAEEKRKKDELAKKGKVVHDIQLLLGDDIEKFNATINTLNKKGNTEHKGLNDFDLNLLEAYLKHLESKKQ